MITVAEARRILGDSADRMSDEQIEAINARYRTLARVLVAWYVEERGQKPEEPR